MRHAAAQQDPNLAALQQPPMSVPSVEMQGMPPSIQPYGHIRQSSAPFTSAHTPNSTPHTPPFDDVKSVPATRLASPNNSPTLPRLLDGYAVDSKRIDDCFSL